MQTNSRNKLSTVSTILISTGLFMLACVGSVYLYSRFEEWLLARPRLVMVNKIISPNVPPLTAIPTVTPTFPAPTPTPSPSPTPGPPMRIEIAKLGVERSIVPVGVVERGGQAEWDTDALFATSGRLDLVGQLQGSVNPGQPGNIVLVGHNYNRGAYYWAGVFVALDTLQSGDTIDLINESDVRFTYQVKQTDHIPWPPVSSDDFFAHLAHLGPLPDETLTLVACDGGTDAPFPARVYVTAKRVPMLR